MPWSTLEAAVHSEQGPGNITTPHDFLKAIGRESEKKVSMDSWDVFWRTTGRELKGASVPVKDRRYALALVTLCFSYW